MFLITNPGRQGKTIFSQIVDDSLIDWANKVDIIVPLWATKVEVATQDKSGQSGASNPLSIRFNNDTGTNYEGVNYLNNGTAITPSSQSGDSDVRIGTLRDSATASETNKTTIYPKNYGLYRNVFVDRSYYASGQRDHKYAYSWLNTVDDITSIQVFTANSTNVSCVITARAWA